MTISKFTVFTSLIATVVAALFAFSVPAEPDSPATEVTSLSAWSPTLYWPGQSGSAGRSAGSPSAPASSSAASGLVLITTEVDFGTAEAAGTGLVIDSDGIVVTNHHVVAGSTSVSVTDPATDRTYSAEVLGYDATTDVAVLQLDGATGLTTITADTNPVAVGQAITAIGNAQGGGQLVSSTGQVTATGQDITVTEDDGTSVDLTDLIGVNASLVPGDSGGALLDSDSEVVGMNVAGSVGGQASGCAAHRTPQSQCSGSVGYAIPISTVLEVADTVLAGMVTDTVSLGRTAAIGVQVSTQTTEAYIVGIVDGGPASQAGITRGSTITSIDAQTVASLTDLSSILSSHGPGDRVSVTWTDSSGASHTATLTLTQAPLA